MRRTLTTTLGLAVAFLSVPALAQEFGGSGDLSFAADRLTGIYFVDEGADFTSISLGGSPWFGHPYTTARLGIDYFIIDQLSLGGSLGIHFVSGEDGPGDDDEDLTGFLFAPRVGYVLNFGDTFGFWPRGGFTFRTFEDNEELALTLEATFFATPGDEWGFLFGPALDAGMTGEGPEALVFTLVTGGVFGWL